MACHGRRGRASSPRIAASWTGVALPSTTSYLETAYGAPAASAGVSIGTQLRVQYYRSGAEWTGALSPKVGTPGTGRLAGTRAQRPNDLDDTARAHDRLDHRLGTGIRIDGR